jgi:hypothetical protein
MPLVGPEISSWACLGVSPRLSKRLTPKEIGIRQGEHYRRRTSAPLGNRIIIPPSCSSLSTGHGTSWATPVRQQCRSSVNAIFRPRWRRWLRENRLPNAHRHVLLTCVCLRRRLFRVTLEISRTLPWYRDVTAGTLTAVWARVVGWGGGIRKIKAIRWGAHYYSLVLNAQPCKYGRYRHRCR